MGYSHLNRDYTFSTAELSTSVGPDGPINSDATVTVSYTVNNGNISNFEILSNGYSVLSRFDELEVCVQVFPLPGDLENAIKEYGKSQQSLDVSVLTQQIEDLNNQISSKEIEINNLNTTNEELQKDIDDLQKELDELKDYSDSLDLTKQEMASRILFLNNRVAQLEKDLENNNSLFKLFDGIGSGLSNLISPILEIEVAGIQVGGVLAFIGFVLFVLLIVGIIIKFKG